MTHVCRQTRSSTNTDKELVNSQNLWRAWPRTAFRGGLTRSPGAGSLAALAGGALLFGSGLAAAADVASAPAAVTRPAAAKPGRDPLALSAERYTLPSGLTVLLRRDPAVPRVVVSLWFNVGSKDEAVGRTGFAHLYEHLMFMGTKNVPGSQFDQIMEAVRQSGAALDAVEKEGVLSAAHIGQRRQLVGKLEETARQLRLSLR